MVPTEHGAHHTKLPVSIGVRRLTSIGIFSHDRSCDAGVAQRGQLLSSICKDHPSSLLDLVRPDTVQDCDGLDD